MRSNLGVTVALVVWGTSVAFGFHRLFLYENEPSPHKSPPDSIDVRVLGMPRQGVEKTLIVAFHPHCPCSMATLYELERILALFQFETVLMKALFYRPVDSPEGWEQGRLWDEARRLGFESIVDLDGRRLRDLNLETSGEILLLDGNLRPTFQGGVTSGRGHAGESRAGRALKNALSGGQETLEVYEVFGCRIFE